MRKISQDDFISECRLIHGNKYDYSIVDYKNSRSPISIICREHGVFSQNSKNHKRGQGCPKCYSNKNLSIQDFIKICNDKSYKYDYSLIIDKKVNSRDYILIKSIETGIIYKQFVRHHMSGLKPTKMEKNSLISKLKQIHSDKFDYDIKEDFVNVTDKICVINRITMDRFYYEVNKHLKGISPNRITLRYFLMRAKEIHGDKYDYSQISEVSGSKSMVDIICTKHGLFKQRVSNHINLKDGCPKCVGKGRWNTSLLKDEFTKIHFNKYDYSKVVFDGSANKVEIICEKHGSFFQNIYKHLLGQGCPECKYSSKGEEYIKDYLERLNIKYIRQHGFDTCRYINRLSFDFYLPDLSICIEFDGIQHFKPIKEFGGDEGFEIVKARDECKNKWCEINIKKLIRIKYNDFNKISKILDNHLVTKK